MEAVGLPVVLNNDVRGRVRVAEEWRAARARQDAADEAASRRAELDALASALVAEIRKAPVERLSANGVTVTRPRHALYKGMTMLRSDDNLKNELNARLAAGATGVQATFVTASPRRGLLHRVCQCGGDSTNPDECPIECCCCILWSAMCACLPMAYWIPRMCGDHDDLISEWEIHVHVQEAVFQPPTPFGGVPWRWSYTSRNSYVKHHCLA